MGLIQDFLQKRKNIKEEKEGFERGKNIEEGFEQRKLSANERELNKYYEEKRQEQIKKKVETIRKQKDKEFWGGHYHNPIDAKNMIKGQKELYKGNKNIFTKKDNFLKEKKLFIKK